MLPTELEDLATLFEVLGGLVTLSDNILEAFAADTILDDLEAPAILTDDNLEAFVLMSNNLSDDFEILLLL